MQSALRGDRIWVRPVPSARRFTFRRYDSGVTHTPAATPTAPGRPARRSPSDLPFRFPAAPLAERLASEREEPGWLRADRLAAAEADAALPVEANQLYTPYIDLRAAMLDEAEPYVLDGPAGLGDDLRAIAAGSLPDGVHVETMSQWL
jgi:hypothetical protein